MTEKIELLEECDEQPKSDEEIRFPMSHRLLISKNPHLLVKEPNKSCECLLKLIIVFIAIVLVLAFLYSIIFREDKKKIPTRYRAAFG